MITKEKIDRINELARKAKTAGLTEEESQERALLRREYVDAFKANLRAQLERIEIADRAREEDGELSAEIKKDTEELISDIDKLS